MTKLKSYIIVLIASMASLYSGDLMSSHIIGGDVTYELISYSSDRTEVTYALEYVIYRDTAGIGFDQLADFGIYRRIPGGVWEVFNVVRNLPIGTVAEIDALNDPCKDQKLSNLIIESAHYNFDITLEVGPYEYMVAYQRCCRNATITNIFDPNNTGAVYDIIITPEAMSLENNSPVFKEFPPIFVCLGEDFDFDHSATDQEGDRLVYTFCTPFASGANPNFSVPSECCFCTKPDPKVCAPIFANVEYTGIYNKANPVGGDPQIVVDSETGRISGVPNILGSFVVGVCVEEYRGGQLIGSYRRDFEFNVELCTPRVVADLESPVLIEEGIPGFTDQPVHQYISCENSFDIVNKSTVISNIRDYKWILFDDQDVAVVRANGLDKRDLSITVPSRGVYQGYMILNDLEICADTSFLQIEVLPLVELDFESSNDPCDPGPLYLTNTSIFESSDIINWTWKYKGEVIGQDQNAIIANPDRGVNTILLEVIDGEGCTTSLEKNVEYDYWVSTAIEQQESVICPETSILWDGEELSTAGNYEHLYTSTRDGCDSLVRQLSLKVLSPPMILEEQAIICFDDSILFDQTYISETGLYEFSRPYEEGDCDSVIHKLNLQVGDSPISIVKDTTLCAGETMSFMSRTISTPGMYEETLLTASFGCDSVYYTLTVYYEDPLEIIFTDTTICFGDSALFKDQWYDTSGVYELMYQSQAGCDSLKLEWTLDVRPQLELDIISEDSIRPYVDHRIDVDINSIVSEVTWTPSEGLSCDDCLDPIVNIDEDKSYRLHVVDEYGCEIDGSIDFFVNPLIDFYVPNIIMKQAPNNPVNQVLFLHVSREYSFNYNLSVFDRWGNRVFHKERISTNVADDGWVPGPHMIGVYVYYIEVLADIEPRQLVGDITVVK